jgi:hypothetical protein
MRKKIFYILIVILGLTLALYIWGLIYSIESPLVKLPRLADTLRIKNDLVFITKKGANRNFQNIDTLNIVADYIMSKFKEVSSRVEEQKFSIETVEYRNIICSFGPENTPRIVIGAHYDVCERQEGADDNASGVAGVLELARLFKNAKLNNRIDLVAYTLEEPPFYGSEFMGSYIHAKYLHDHNIPVKGMISLEMIGYYSEKEHSQSFPLGVFHWFYGHKGDYILLVQKFGNGRFGHQFKNYMMENQTIRTKSFTGPSWLPGVDYSDHRNYWKFDYSALMVTNTAFYRNKNYHTEADRLETLNIGNIGLVVDEVFRAVNKIK